MKRPLVNRFHSRKLASTLWVLTLVTSAGLGCAQQRHRVQATATAAPSTPPGSVNSASATPIADETVARIRDEGLNRSQVMQTLDYLCNVIGPRLTASPACKRANEWTRDQLASWGLANAHLEEWGPFGRGWSLERFSLQVVSPYAIVLNGHPKAWSPGFDEPLESRVVYLEAENEKELEKYEGQLDGAIVLIGKPRDVEPRFEPLASRLDDERLERLASARTGSSAMLGQARTQTASERRAQFAASGALGEALVNRANREDRAEDRSGEVEGGNGAGDRAEAQPATQPTDPSRSGRRRRFDPFASRALKFAADQGAALVITPSTVGDGGTLFVSSASIPGDSRFGPSTNPTTEPTTAPAADRPRVWSIDAPDVPAQVTLAVEDYNRLVRMLEAGEKLRMRADLRVQFHQNDDLMCYNTIAEIPGTDPELKHQIVMVGAHLDSWHSGTGATDNAAGSAAAMEAMRIIKALDLRPRRTIRVALWTGEEQGLLGSAAYVKQHFGHDPRAGSRSRSRSDSNEPDSDSDPATQPATAPSQRIVKEKDYENLSVYFNLDNGTGKIRGIYAQGNAGAAPLFRQWLAPFADLGATTVTISNTGGTDHQSFDRIGLPGFQFIQDPIEYSSRTHHSNYDVYDRLQADDLKQASTIMAAFIWQAANMDERFPRKVLDRTDGR